MKGIAVIYTGNFCGCCGRIHRHLLRGTIPQDENGGEIFQVKVVDRCEQCGTILAESSVICWPMLHLQELFERYNNSPGSSWEEFNCQMKEELARAGGQWVERLSA